VLILVMGKRGGLNWCYQLIWFGDDMDSALIFSLALGLFLVNKAEGVHSWAEEKEYKGLRP
jgi:hypothetical protein